MAAPRRYDASRRREAAAGRRQRILDAFLAQLAVPGATELSVPAAAAAAGVSVRTVYSHFPDAAAMRAAASAEIERQLVANPPPLRTAADLPELCRYLYRQFEQHEQLVRASLSPGVANEIRNLRRRPRRNAIEEALATIGADPVTLRLATALITHLSGARGGVALIDDEGLTAAEAADAASWAVGALIKAMTPSDPTVPSST